MPPLLHPRHNAIAELDAHIAQATVTRARYLQDLKAFPGARRTRVLLRQVEERLAQLRRSRETLLSRQSGVEEPGIPDRRDRLAYAPPARAGSPRGNEGTSRRRDRRRGRLHLALISDRTFSASARLQHPGPSEEPRSAAGLRHVC